MNFLTHITARVGGAHGEGMYTSDEVIAMVKSELSRASDDMSAHLGTVWAALHSHREDAIPEGTDEYDRQWEDICHAVAVVTEALQLDELRPPTVDLKYGNLRILQGEVRVIDWDKQSSGTVSWDTHPGLPVPEPPEVDDGPE